MQKATVYRDGAPVGEYELLSHGDTNAPHRHREREYSLTIRAAKEDIRPGDILYAGGVNGWHALATRIVPRSDLLQVQVKTAPAPELP